MRFDCKYSRTRKLLKVVPVHASSRVHPTRELTYDMPGLALVWTVFQDLIPTI